MPAHSGRARNPSCRAAAARGESSLANGCIQLVAFSVPGKHTSPSDGGRRGGKSAQEPWRSCAQPRGSDSLLSGPREPFVRAPVRRQAPGRRRSCQRPRPGNRPPPLSGLASAPASTPGLPKTARWSRPKRCLRPTWRRRLQRQQPWLTPPPCHHRTAHMSRGRAVARRVAKQGADHRHLQDHVSDEGFDRGSNHGRQGG